MGEGNLLDSKHVLAGNRRNVSNFHLTLYKRSDDSHLRDEQQLLYLTQVYQPQHSRCFLSRFRLRTALGRSASCLETELNVFHEVDDEITEKLCYPAFVDQETACDTFEAQPYRYHLHGRACNACLHFQPTSSLPSWMLAQLGMALFPTEMHLLNSG
ncbi:hypothetical protein TNCV_3518321 [Trichonephila clavipes]|uniref:Uncharacterized protein n=1 Tax=Trichonephila clavipes TaxID=2585209 RepID=A0A8X6SU60_TRICX|nr:hypothetical protein TNCV_3518321 [Trichonephila clavipes]